MVDALGCCPEGFPGDMAVSSLPVLSWGEQCCSQGQEGTQPRDRRAERPGLTSEVAIEAQVGADEAVIGLQDLSPTEPC